MAVAICEVLIGKRRKGNKAIISEAIVRPKTRCGTQGYSPHVDMDSCSSFMSESAWPVAHG